MTQKKEFLAISNEGLHEFNITVEDIDNKGTKYSIFRSNGEQWQSNVKGELILSMLDTGNEFKLSKGLRELDYADAVCLRILLTIEHKTSTDDGGKLLEYKIIETKPVLEV